MLFNFSGLAPLNSVGRALVLRNSMKNGKIMLQIHFWGSSQLKFQGQHYTYDLYTISGWWFEPISKILVNWDDYIWENKIHVPNHQPDICCIYDLYHVRGGEPPSIHHLPAVCSCGKPGHSTRRLTWASSWAPGNVPCLNG